jgi:predicted ferric reductase
MSTMPTTSARTVARTTLANPDPLALLPQAAREGLVAAMVAAGTAAVIALWWHDTPARSLHGAAEFLTAAGRITGLLGAYLVLVEVLLMARIPWLDAAIGMDRLAVWHRRNGEYAISLLVAHAALTIWGYGLTDRANLARETRTILTYPDMWLATAGLAILVAVGAASARAARRRLDYQVWYLLHLGTYIAIALSFSHQLATGADFIGHPLNRGLWWALYAGVSALVVGYRVVVPVLDNAHHQMRVAAVVPEAPGVFSVYVTGRRLDELGAEPGQFFYWRFLTRNAWWEAHPFSLSAAPRPDLLRLTVKALGDHTAELSQLTPGTRVIAEGPYGAFTRRRHTRRRVLLIGGGAGIAPLRALFETLPAHPGELTLVYRASSAEDLLFRDELDEIARRRQAYVHYLVGPRTQRPDPLAPGALAKLVPHLARHDVWVCGPPGMADVVVTSLKAAGLPSRHIHSEGFEL